MEWISLDLKSLGCSIVLYMILMRRSLHHGLKPNFIMKHYTDILSVCPEEVNSNLTHRISIDEGAQAMTDSDKE